MPSQPLLYYPPYQMGSFPSGGPGIRYSPQYLPQGPRPSNRFVPLQVKIIVLLTKVMIMIMMMMIIKTLRSFFFSVGSA